MLAQQVINGLGLGLVYGLVALGYTMVYGVLRFINFAHGEVFMWGAFVGLFLARAGLAFPCAVALVMLFGGVLALIVERMVYRPLRGASQLVITTAALGLSIVLQNLALVLVGAHTFGFPRGWFPLKTWQIGGAVLPNVLVVTALMAGSLLALTSWFVYRTRWGKAIRAVSQDREVAGTMGIDVDRIIQLTFAVGGALGGIAGLLTGVYYDAVYFTMGYSAGLKAFTAAVLGGIGSVPGAVIGGVMLGLAENFAAAHGASHFKEGVAFLVLVAVLLMRPWGLLGSELRERA